MHKCKRCGSEFARKQTLLTHLQRVRPCQSVVEDIPLYILIDELKKPKITDGYQCEYCLAFFKQSQGKYQHKKLCKKRPLDVMNTLIHQVQVLTKELEDLKSDKRIVNTMTTNNNTTNNTNNIQNNITINIKSFGRENMQHILDNKQYLTAVCARKDIVDLIENIHFDKEYPENHNVRLRSLKNDLMETFVDGKWLITDKEDTLDQLIEKGYNVLDIHCRKNKEDIIEEEGEETYDDVRRWLRAVYDDKHVRKPIRKQLLLLFLNNKTLLLGKDDDG